MSLRALEKYLLLPLSTAPLLLIAIFSLLLAMATRAGFMGIPLALIVLSWFFKYAFVLLDHTVDGAREPPVLSVEMINPVSEQRSLILLIIVTGIFFASDAAAYWFGPILGALLGVVLVAMLPAVIGVQGVTGSLLQSLNLHRCMRLIVRLGRDYVLIIVSATVLLATAIVVSSVDAIPQLFRLAFDMYAWLALFAIIGGVLFERRLDIGLEAAYSPERYDDQAGRELDRERDRQIDLIYAEWRGGAHINACKTIDALLARSASPGNELEWLYEKTAAWPDPRLPNQLAQAWLPHLLEEKRNGRVLEVLKERLGFDATFRPATSSELLRCARLARDGGERKTARLLLQDFAGRFPDDPLQKVAAELSAQLER